MANSDVICKHATIIPYSGSKQVFIKSLFYLNHLFKVEKFTYYIENFVNELIDVLDILELAEKDFDKLGITNIGIKAKLIKKAKQYCK